MGFMRPPAPDQNGGHDWIRIRVHYEDILPEDITTVDGIPVTAPARTLLDIATCVDDGELKQALATALARKLTTKAELVAVMERYPHHAGKARLTSALGLPVG